MKSVSAGSDSRPFVSQSSRRSHRVMLRLRITVTGVSARGPFSEETHALVINAHGALISAAAGLFLNQILEIQSAGNAQSRPCRVVFVGPVMDGRMESGIEFTEPAPRFWPVVPTGRLVARLATFLDAALDFRGLPFSARAASAARTRPGGRFTRARARRNIELDLAGG